MNLWPFFCFIFLAHLTVGQAATSKVGEFLRGADMSAAVSARTSAKERIRRRGGNSVLFHNLQLRYTADDINLDQEYTLRASPLGFGEHSAARAVTRNTLGLAETEIELTRLDELRSRYLLLAEFKYWRELTGILENIERLEKTRLDSTMARFRTQQVDIKDLVGAEESYLESRAEVRTAMGELKRVRADLQDRGFAAADEQYDLVSPQIISERLGTLETGKREFNQHHELLEKNLALAESELALEKATDRRFLDFIGLELDRTDKEEKYSLELAVNLPFFSAADTDINKRERDRAKAEVEKISGEKEWKSEFNLALTTLRATLEEWSLWRKSEQAQNLAGYRRALRNTRRAEAGLLITVELAAIKAARQRLELEWKIHTTYVEALYLLGMLGQEPRRNFLSATQEAF